MSLYAANQGHPSPRLEADFGVSVHSALLIVGLGKTGLSIARFLAQHGLRFAITDTRENPPGLEAFRDEFPDAAVFLGGFNQLAFEASSHLIMSPGVALDHPFIQAAQRRGVHLMGDLDLFAAVCEAPILAVTGANGKSTVTTLLGLMGEADGKKVRMGGNLGTPMLELLSRETELYVLELSSFQLDTSHRLEPLAATVLNISPDHMDRYQDLGAYAKSKQRIFKGQGAMVLNRDDPMVAAMLEPSRETFWFSVEDEAADFCLREVSGETWLCHREHPVMCRKDLKLHGGHNVANALAALAMGYAAGFSEAAMVRTLSSFKGLPHRTEWVEQSGGVDWINDSKATNIGACVAALQGTDQPVILIAGGDGKGADFRELRPVVARKVRALVLMGRDASKLQAALSDLVETRMVDTMKEAVSAARSLALPGDVVLLAPACASLDQYKDYQERGRLFAEEVRKGAP
jgi:UDP-N-acetylmuramoylalanine--D-glutamate ligase